MRRPNSRRRKKMITHAPWLKLVSADFLLHAETMEPVTKWQMMAMGVPLSRIMAIEAAAPQIYGDHHAA